MYPTSTALRVNEGGIICSAEYKINIQNFIGKPQQDSTLGAPGTNWRVI